SPSTSGLKASVFTIATSPRDRTWYAGTADGVYRSIDNGESWTKSSAGINPNYAGYIDTYQIAIDPAHPGTAYAGTLSGTYKSEDRGSTWTLVDPQTFFPGLTTQAQLVVDGNGWVYLGTAGVRRSQDGGKTWTTISDGFVKGPTGVYEQLDT